MFQILWVLSVLLYEEYCGVHLLPIARLIACDSFYAAHFLFWWALIQYGSHSHIFSLIFEQFQSGYLLHQMDNCLIEQATTHRRSSKWQEVSLFYASMCILCETVVCSDVAGTSNNSPLSCALQPTTTSPPLVALARFYQLPVLRVKQSETVPRPLE